MSDCMRPGSSLVVGTAGHIDHGKTSLVRALTGIDTDRLPEEKRRGISIDLGFAHLELGEGRSVSFVDVPGHERFVRNMLAGASGIRAVMLVVAATEGVMPQTREHFEICRLLNVRHGFVVLTKVDIAPEEETAFAIEQIRELCEGSFLENAPIVQASCQTGAGLDAVKAELTRLSGSVEEVEAAYIPRLWIDRKFVKSGFGTVVTGTLASGKLLPRGDIVILPRHKPVRIRSMQMHGHQVDSVTSGQRAAVNITGVESSDIQRGDVLTIVSGVKDSFVMDASIEWLAGSERPRVRTNYTLHIGSAECVASVRVLHSIDEQRSVARIWSSAALLALPRDRFILRRLSPAQTVGGGEILDIAPALRLSRARTVHRLTVLMGADDFSRVEMMVSEASAGKSLSELQRATGLTIDRIRDLVKANPNLLLCETQRIVITKQWLGERRNRLAKWLVHFHQQNPSVAGAPLSQARLGLKPELAEIVFEKNPNVRVSGDLVSLATHKPLFSQIETEDLARMEQAFRAGGFNPLAAAEVVASVSGDRQRNKRILDVLLKSKRLVRVAEDLIFHADVIAHIRTSLAAHRGKKFSVPEFKDWTHMSRKYAIPMLEYLDRERVTRREGEQRVIL